MLAVCASFPPPKELSFQQARRLSTKRPLFEGGLPDPPRPHPPPRIVKLEIHYRPLILHPIILERPPQAVYPGIDLIAIVSLIGHVNPAHESPILSSDTQKPFTERVIALRAPGLLGVRRVPELFAADLGDGAAVVD